MARNASARAATTAWSKHNRPAKNRGFDTWLAKNRGFDDVALPPSPFRPGFGRDPPTTPPTHPEGSRLLKNAGNAHVLSGQT